MFAQYREIWHETVTATFLSVTHFQLKTTISGGQHWLKQEMPFEDEIREGALMPGQHLCNFKVSAVAFWCLNKQKKERKNVCCVVMSLPPCFVLKHGGQNAKTRLKRFPSGRSKSAALLYSAPTSVIFRLDSKAKKLIIHTTEDILQDNERPPPPHGNVSAQIWLVSL